MLPIVLLSALAGIGVLSLLIDGDDGESSETDTAETVELGPGEDTFEGGPGAERAIGNAIANEMLGGGGNDTLLGNGGGDAIDAGDGNDTVFGGAGDDFAVGGAGDDRVFLGEGNDEYGSDAVDRYDAGDDFVRGGAGADFIADVRGANVLYGDVGDDTLVAADGIGEEGYVETAEFGTVDQLFGGFGDDTLVGDDGDEMTGGADADSFMAVTDLDRADQNAVVITDFNPEEDVLTIALAQVPAETADVTFEVNADDTGVNALYDGRTVAVLRGLGASDLAGLSATVVTP